MSIISKPLAIIADAVKNIVTDVKEDMDAIDAARRKRAADDGPQHLSEEEQQMVNAMRANKKK